MKILLFYNPKAGNEDFPLQKCTTILKKSGAEVISQNTKEEGYEEILNLPCDFIIVAGGDGTVGKIIKRIIENPLPLAILPFGSANNFANSLQIDKAISTILYSWKNKNFKKISIGILYIGTEKIPFIESAGWGLFAELLLKKEKDIITKNNADKVEWGLEKMIEILKNLKSSYYEIFLDGVDYSENYYWAEILNTNTMGPQIPLAPEASPVDNYLDIVLVKEKDKMEEYLSAQKEKRIQNLVKPFQAKSIRISSEEPLHIDGDSYEIKKTVLKKGGEIAVELHPNKIEIMNSKFG